MGFWDSVGEYSGYNWVSDKVGDAFDYLGSKPSLGDPNRADYQLGGGNWAQMGQSRAAQVGGRRAPVSPWGQDQRYLADALRGQMTGQNSIAQMQLRQNADRNISQQQALAASASPQMAAMASRMAAQNAGRVNQGLAGQAAMAGLAERMAAMQAYGQLAGQARGQDLQSALQQQQLNDQAWQQAMNLGLTGATTQLGANMGYDAARLGQQRAEAAQPSMWEKFAGAGLGYLSASNAGKSG